MYDLGSGGDDKKPPFDDKKINVFLERFGTSRSKDFDDDDEERKDGVNNNTVEDYDPAEERIVKMAYASVTDDPETSKVAGSWLKAIEKFSEKPPESGEELAQLLKSAGLNGDIHHNDGQNDFLKEPSGRSRFIDEAKTNIAFCLQPRENPQEVCLIKVSMGNALLGGGCLAAKMRGISETRSKVDHIIENAKKHVVPERDAGPIIKVFEIHVMTELLTCMKNHTSGHIEELFSKNPGAAIKLASAHKTISGWAENIFKYGIRFYMAMCVAERDSIVDQTFIDMYEFGQGAANGTIDCFDLLMKEGIKWNTFWRASCETYYPSAFVMSGEITRLIIELDQRQEKLIELLHKQKETNKVVSEDDSDEEFYGLDFDEKPEPITVTVQSLATGTAKISGFAVKIHEISWKRKGDFLNLKCNLVKDGWIYNITNEEWSEPETETFAGDGVITEFKLEGYSPIILDLTINGTSSALGYQIVDNETLVFEQAPPDTCVIKITYLTRQIIFGVKLTLTAVRKVN